MTAAKYTTGVSIYIPGKPTAWARPDQNGGQRYTAPKTKAKSREIAQLAQVAMVGHKHFTGAVKVEIIAWVRNRLARPDCDNFGKLILDALNGVVWTDDALVVDLRIEKRNALKADLQTVVHVEEA